MIDRRKVVAITGGALMAGPICSLVRSADRVYRIGYLDPRSPTNTVDEPLRRTLLDLGYLTGRNTIFEERFANRQLDRLPALAAELVQLGMDVIVAVSGPSIRAARDATATIPIVMSFSGDDPVKSGFVASLARPGGNVTGVTILFRELAPKWMELLLEVVPGMTRLAVMSNPARPAHADYVNTMQAQLPAGAKLQHIEADPAGHYDAAFAAAVAGRAEGLIILADLLFTQDAARLAALAAQRRLPSVYQFREFALQGGLMAYGPDERALTVLAAHYVDKVLQGVKPEDLPIQLPTRFTTTLNLGTAKSMGLDIPKSLMLRAEEVV